MPKLFQFDGTNLEPVFTTIRHRLSGSFAGLPR